MKLRSLLFSTAVAALCATAPLAPAMAQTVNVASGASNASSKIPLVTAGVTTGAQTVANGGVYSLNLGNLTFGGTSLAITAAPNGLNPVAIAGSPFTSNTAPAAFQIYAGTVVTATLTGGAPSGAVWLNGAGAPSGGSSGGAVTLASGAVASGAYSAGSIAAGAYVSGSILSGALAAGSITNGADVVEGTITTGHGCLIAGYTVIGCLGQIDDDVKGAIPAGTNAIGAVIPNPVTSTNGSTTVVTGNTFQTLLASNASRKGCLIQNPSDATETLYVNIKDAVGSATKARSYQLPAGASFSCTAGGNVITDIINVTATTSAHAFVEADQ